MKAITGLPTEAYLKVSEEAPIQLADLLQLVQQLEKGATPAYLARYRPDVCGGLDERAVNGVHSRLKECLDIADRKISILTAIERRGALTPELRQRLEQTMDRRDLEDIFLPYRPKKRDGVDEAVDKGLEPLARFLWAQDQAADIDTVVAKFVDAEKGIADPESALQGAYAIAGRWLGEKPEIRRELRKLFLRDGQVVVSGVKGKKAQKHQHLVGYRSIASKISWRQMLTIRRAARDGVLNFTLDIPLESTVKYLGTCLVTDEESAYTPHLHKIAEVAASGQLMAGLREDVLQIVEDRSDVEAIRSFEKGLRKALLGAPATGLTIVGLETSRPGGWRASVVNPDGELVACAVVRSDGSGPGDKKSASGGPNDGAQVAATDIPQESAAPATDEAPVVEQNPKPAEAVQLAEVQESVDEPAVVAAEAVAVEAIQDQPDSTDEPAQAAEISRDTKTPPPAAVEETEAVVAVVPEDQSGEVEAAAPASAEEQPVESESPAVELSPEEQVATEQANDKAPALKAFVPEPIVTAPKNVRREATPVASLAELIARHNVDLIVFPNGPGLRQTERFLRSKIRESGHTKVLWKSISDAGTWIYANSKSAKREMPQYEPAIRSAACLARRVQDPLSEMVKVDPKTLGIGPGYHEVEPKRLREALQATVEECAHQVGVDLNRAPLELLALVPGLTERLAKRIVEYRQENGRFKRREDARKVQGLSDRIYRQAAGFFRVDGENPLDNTGVHPSFYSLVDRLVAAAESDTAAVLADPAILEKISPAELAGPDNPAARVEAVLAELHPRRRQVRGAFQMPKASVELRTDEELKVGAKVEGTVANVTEFGAFIDIGGDHDGLLHISQIADELMNNSKPEIKMGDRVAVYITALDKEGKRISLSMREPRVERQRPPRAAAERARGATANGGPRRPRAAGQQSGRGRKPEEHSFGPDQKELAREAKRVGGLSIEEKLSMLKDKFRTKT